MTKIDFYHSLPYLQQNAWYQEKATNWDFPLYFLDSILFYHYDQFFLIYGPEIYEASWFKKE